MNQHQTNVSCFFLDRQSMGTRTGTVKQIEQEKTAAITDTCYLVNLSCSLQYHWHLFLHLCTYYVYQIFDFRMSIMLLSIDNTTFFPTICTCSFHSLLCSLLEHFINGGDSMGSTEWSLSLVHVHRSTYGFDTWISWRHASSLCLQWIDLSKGRNQKKKKNHICQSHLSSNRFYDCQWDHLVLIQVGKLSI